MISVRSGEDAHAADLAKKIPGFVKTQCAKMKQERDRKFLDTDHWSFHPQRGLIRHVPPERYGSRRLGVRVLRYVCPRCAFGRPGRDEDVFRRHTATRHPRQRYRKFVARWVPSA